MHKSQKGKLSKTTTFENPLTKTLTNSINITILYFKGNVSILENVQEK